MSGETDMMPLGSQPQRPATQSVAPPNNNINNNTNSRPQMSASPVSSGARRETNQYASRPLTDDDSAEGDTIVCQVKKYNWVPPADFADFPYREHLGEGAQYLRDFILGVNDGLVSTFLLVVAVVGGQSNATQCLLAGIAGAIAGSISMGLGEYVATKSQTQVSKSELDLEMEHFKYHRDVELEQLRDFLRNVNLSGNLLEAVVSEVGRNDESLLKMMMAFEFGITEDGERNPIVAMLMSGRLFFLGSLPTVIPFFFVKDAHIGLAIAGCLVGATLFAVGAYKTKTTKGSPWHEGGENFFLGCIAGAISYLVGLAFDSAANH